MCVHTGGAAMATTKVFRNGNSQALRIPSEMHTNRREFIIKQIGETYIAYPVDDPWQPFRQAVKSFQYEEVFEREQPSWEQVAEREDL